MTNEEAIEVIEQDIPCEYDNDLIEALNMAIAALKAEPCEDCVSREAMLNGLASIAKAKARSDAQKALMGRIMFFTEQLPSVAPKSRTGKWVAGRTIGDGFTCSECNTRYRMYPMIYRFCPKCGTKMEEVSE